MVSSILVFLRCYAINTSSWFATKKLHEDMVRRVLKAPINLYFDVTPIGRILNKFSKDLSVIELQLASTIGSALVQICLIISIVIVSAVVVIWVLLLLPIMLFLAVLVYRYSINGIRELTRIESLTKSPLLSFLSETYSGSSTIRAFKK